MLFVHFHVSITDMKSTTRGSEHRTYVQGARAKAAEATGRRIIDAFLARLMTHWFDEITLDCVAEDAGVTVQTVVRRFGGKEGLLAESAKTLAGRITMTRATPRGDIEQLVKNLIADYEQTGDAIMRLLALEERHPALRACTDLGRRWHRGWVTEMVAEPLDALAAADRTRAIDALVAVTDVYTWKLLRRDMGRSIAATATTLAGLIRATIDEFCGPRPKGDER